MYMYFILQYRVSDQTSQRRVRLEQPTRFYCFGCDTQGIKNKIHIHSLNAIDADDF